MNIPDRVKHKDENMKYGRLVRSETSYISCSGVHKPFNTLTNHTLNKQNIAKGTTITYSLIYC